jgi:hypothetical protein
VIHDRSGKIQSKDSHGAAIQIRLRADALKSAMGLTKASASTRIEAERARRIVLQPRCASIALRRTLAASDHRRRTASRRPWESGGAAAMPSTAAAKAITERTTQVACVEAARGLHTRSIRLAQREPRAMRAVTPNSRGAVTLTGT